MKNGLKKHERNQAEKNTKTWICQSGYDFYFLYLQGPFYFNMQISVWWKTEESASRKGHLQENDRALTWDNGI